MNAIQIAIDNREKGAVPISIGTALAIEAGCGVYPDRPETPAPFTRVKQLWVNLRTIVRNLYACLPTDLKESLLPDDMWRAALEELTILQSAVSQGSFGKTAVVYYVSDYVRLAQRYPGALLKEPKTEKQIYQHRIEETALKLLLANNHEHHVEFFEFDIQGQFPASFILTHLPIDLLARYRFQRLELLESHTGKIKGPGAWNSKLTNGKELSTVPFNHFTLQLFGDNGNLFLPQSISVRREFMKQAHRWNLTNVSTLDKIREIVKKVDNDAHRHVLEKLL